MAPLYDFSCEAGHTTEQFASRETEMMYCPCGLNASRQAVYRVGVTGFASTPVGQREINMKEYSEAAATLEHQQTVQTNVDGSQKPAPRLWDAAKKRASQLQAHGVKDSSEVK